MEVNPKKHSALHIIIILALLVLVGMIAAFFYSNERGENLLEDQLREVEITNYKEEASFYLREGNFDMAIDAGHKLIAELPEDISGYLSLANAYLQRGSVEFDEDFSSQKALEILEVAKTIDPKNSNVYRLIGYAHEIVENYEKAEEAYNNAITIAPGDSYSYGARGHMYELLGEFEKAEEDYLLAMGTDPENEKAILDLATLYVQTEQYDVYDVDLMFSQALELSNDSITKANIYDSMGFYAFYQEKYGEAINHYEKAISQDGRLTSAWIGVAFANLMLADTDDDEEYTLRIDNAFDAVDNALGLNENIANAYVAQAIILGYFGDTASEVEMYNEALVRIDLDITLGAHEKSMLRENIENTLALIEDDEFEEIGS